MLVLLKTINFLALKIKNKKLKFKVDFDDF